MDYLNLFGEKLSRTKSWNPPTLRDETGAFYKYVDYKSELSSMLNEGRGGLSGFIDLSNTDPKTPGYAFFKEGQLRYVQEILELKPAKYQQLWIKDNFVLREVYETEKNITQIYSAKRTAIFKHDTLNIAIDQYTHDVIEINFKLVEQDKLSKKFPRMPLISLCFSTKPVGVIYDNNLDKTDFSNGLYHHVLAVMKKDPTLFEDMDKVIDLIGFINLSTNQLIRRNSDVFDCFEKNKKISLEDATGRLFEVFSKQLNKE